MKVSKIKTFQGSIFLGLQYGYTDTPVVHYKKSCAF